MSSEPQKEEFSKFNKVPAKLESQPLKASEPELVSA